MKTGLSRCLAAFLFAVVLLLAAVLTAADKPAADNRPAPDEVLKILTAGNARFAAGQSTHPQTDAARRTQTATQGQFPLVTILGCSDSRAPVERIFDLGIGDIFVVRVAGNVSDVDEIGSVEYGVEHLGAPLVIVLGHTQCGAVTAVVKKDKLHGNIEQLVSKIVPAAEKTRRENPKLDEKDLITLTVKANVWQSIEDMYYHSAIMREMAKSGRVKVVGAIYDLMSGKVEWLGPHPEETQFLSKTGGGH